MPNVQKLNKGMIESYLKAHNHKYLIDSDGDYLVEFAYDDEAGCSISVWLCIEGSRDDIYSVLMTSDRRIPKQQWEHAIMVCNTWNKEKLWPKAYLYVRDPASDTYGRIRLEHQIDVEKGIHQELLDDFTRMTIVFGYQFWKWAHGEHNL